MMMMVLQKKVKLLKWLKWKCKYSNVYDTFVILLVEMYWHLSTKTKGKKKKNDD